MDSTEVGRIVPIYEAIGTLGRARFVAPFMPRSICSIPTCRMFCPRNCARVSVIPRAAKRIIHTHFPPPGESIDALNTFRSPAQQRLIFEEFFLYQLSLALDRKTTRKENAIAFRLREDNIREALKRILPSSPRPRRNACSAEIAADLEKPAPMNRLLQGDVGSGKTIVALQAAVIAIENGLQAALMAPTEILAVQHYLAAKRILAPAGYRVELLISGLKFRDKTAVLESIRTGEAQTGDRHARFDRRQSGVRAARLRRRRRAAPLRRAATQAPDGQSSGARPRAARAGADRHADSAHAFADSLRRSRRFRHRRAAARPHAHRNAHDHASRICPACGNLCAAKSTPATRPTSSIR